MGADVTNLSAIPQLMGVGALTAANASAYHISEFTSARPGEEMDETRQETRGGNYSPTKR